jgi:hypothetical protein
MTKDSKRPFGVAIVGWVDRFVRQGADEPFAQWYRVRAAVAVAGFLAALAAVNSVVVLLGSDRSIVEVVALSAAISLFMWAVGTCLALLLLAIRYVFVRR